MKECIDLYSRLIIATITFVGPIIITLLSTFSAGKKRREELARETEEKISQKAANDVQNNPHTIRDTITKTKQEYEQLDKQTQNELRSLSPIVQFWHIFSRLGISLLLLLFSYLIRSDKWNLYNHLMSIIVLTLSVLFYFYALYYLIRVLYTIINTKKITEG